MKKITVCFILIFIVSGCQTLQELSKNVGKPQVSVAGVQVTDFSFRNIQLGFDIRVKNPNPISLSMLSYSYDFKINGYNFVQGNHRKSLTIAATGASTIQIPVRINYLDLYNLFQSLKHKKRSTYQLSANLYFNVPVLGRIKIPIHKSGKLPMLKIPKINLSGIQLKNLSLSAINMVLNLTVKNPNGFALLLKNMSYKLLVSGHPWIEANRTGGISINSNGKQTISIPISLNLLQIGRSAFQLLNNSGKIHYQLKGDLNFGIEQALFKGAETIFHFNEKGLAPLIR